MDKQQLIRLAESYASHCGLTLSTVSTYAANDGKWLIGLKGQTSCTLRKASTVMLWFAQNWPADLEWPSDVPRPTGANPQEAA